MKLKKKKNKDEAIQRVANRIGRRNGAGFKKEKRSKNAPHVYDTKSSSYHYYTLLLSSAARETGGKSEMSSARRSFDTRVQKHSLGYAGKRDGALVVRRTSSVGCSR